MQDAILQSLDRNKGDVREWSIKRIKKGPVEARPEAPSSVGEAREVHVLLTTLIFPPVMHPMVRWLQTQQSVFVGFDLSCGDLKDFLSHLKPPQLEMCTTAPRSDESIATAFLTKIAERVQLAAVKVITGHMAC